ncbi:hypothetical protein Vretimale_13884, partial [Volvox reticuliferus]
GLPSDSLFLLEAGAEALTSWPYMIHPPPPPSDLSYNPYTTIYDSVAAWAPDFRTDMCVAKLLSLLVRWRPAVDLWTLFGAPAREIPLNVGNYSTGGNSTSSGGDGGGYGWREVLLPLLPLPPASGGPPARVHVVHACCD